MNDSGLLIDKSDNRLYVQAYHTEILKQRSIDSEEMDAHDNRSKDKRLSERGEREIALRWYVWES